MAAESKPAIIAAILANAALAVTKFAVAIFTGSAAMLSEAIHSLVDTGNGGLLLLGIRLSKRPADDKHPFGYGLEVYFWSLIVAILIFGVGGGMSAYEGILHLRHPRTIDNHFWIYLVLGVGVVFESISTSVAIRAFRTEMSGRSAWETIRTTKDPTTFAVLLEDLAALAGLLVAFVGVLIGQLTGQYYWDGIASIVIGLILMVVATILAWESRLLLIGEGADPKMVAGIRAIAEQDPAVVHSAQPLTMHFGPHDVLVNLELEFEPSLSAAQIEAAVDRLEQQIRAKYPAVKRIFLEMQSLVQK